MKTIGLASDHAGFELKQYVKQWLDARGWSYKDFGTYTAESCDYPDFAHPLALAVEAGECYPGIAICGSGEGIGITLNKHQGIRAALCWIPEIAHLARQHNDANVLVMPGRFITCEEADRIMTDSDFKQDLRGPTHGENRCSPPVLPRPSAFLFRPTETPRRKTGKRPARCRKLSRCAIPSCTLREAFQLRDSVLHAAGSFPAPGKRPHDVGKLSSSGKTSPQRRQAFQLRENVPTTSASFPASGKRPHDVGKLSSSGKSTPTSGLSKTAPFPSKNRPAHRPQMPIFAQNQTVTSERP